MKKCKRIVIFLIRNRNRIIKSFLYMFLVYFIPFVNILLIAFCGINQISIQNFLNIILATNACYLMTSDRYFVFTKQKNSKYTYLKHINFALSVTFFAVSTILLQFENIIIEKLKLLIIIVTIITIIINYVLDYMTQEEKEKIEELTYDYDNNTRKKASKMIEEKNKIEEDDGIDLRGDEDENN